MTVITQLHKRDNGFGASDGWTLHVWQRELTIDGETVLHRVNYIIQAGTGHVLTSQYKAWNDTVRMAMIIDLVWVPTKNNACMDGQLRCTSNRRDQETSKRCRYRSYVLPSEHDRLLANVRFGG